MKIAVIGANGNVGTELCYILQDICDVIPIVRNKIGSVFLEHHGIKCRIGDLMNSENAKAILQDVDVIINATWVSDRFSGSQNQTSRLINKTIIENSFRYSKKNAVIIYLSTIRAFANKVDPTTSKYWPPRYDVEKQFLEKIMKKNAVKYNKKGISFRCGHVFGEGQPNTIEIRKKLSENKKITVPVNPNTASNILHIITLKEAVFKCLDKNIKSGTYSLVNNPQWTWKEIFNFYNNNCDLKFISPNSEKTRLNQKIYRLLKGKRKFLIPVLYHMPKRFEPKIIMEMSIRKYKSEINKLKLEETITNGNFAYLPIPGIKLSNLTKTKELLKNYNFSIFQMKNGHKN
jgi:dTDP-4-dehydrorhamnose reductase